MPGIIIPNIIGQKAQPIWGEPGAKWTNDTEDIWYQFHAHWQNTCGACAQYDGAVKKGSWPIGLHRGCNCTQDPVKPGAQAQPFTDFRATLEGLDESQKRAAVGASNYKLIEQGVVKWEDVVSPYRVRTLQEVVATQKLSITQMEAVGIRPKIAADAYAAVHTPAHQIAQQHRQQLIEKLKGAGLSREQMKQLISGGVAQKISAPRTHGGPSEPVSGGINVNLLRGWLAAFDIKTTPARAAAAMKRTQTVRAQEEKIAKKPLAKMSEEEAQALFGDDAKLLEAWEEIKARNPEIDSTEFEKLLRKRLRLPK